MNVTCIPTGNGYTVLDAHNDIVGVLIRLDDNYMVEKPIAFKKAFVDVKRMAEIDERIRQSKLKRSELRIKSKTPILYQNNVGM